MTTPQRFLAELKHWSLHCSVNAAPSLVVALFYLQMVKSPGAVAAMLGGIALFIAAYTCLTTFAPEFRERDSLVGRAIRVGTKVRLVMSLISLPLLAPNPMTFLVPDLWAGLLATSAVSWAGEKLGAGPAFQFFESHGGGDLSATAVFSTVVIEGLILSLLLFMISFIALFVLQRKSVRHLLHERNSSPV